MFVALRRCVFYNCLSSRKFITFEGFRPLSFYVQRQGNNVYEYSAYFPPFQTPRSRIQFTMETVVTSEFFFLLTLREFNKISYSLNYLRFEQHKPRRIYNSAVQQPKFSLTIYRNKKMPFNVCFSHCV